jgi:hypothetical protein
VCKHFCHLALRNKSESSSLLRQHPTICIYVHIKSLTTAVVVVVVNADKNKSFTFIQEIQLQFSLNGGRKLHSFIHTCVERTTKKMKNDTQGINYCNESGE